MRRVRHHCSHLRPLLLLALAFALPLLAQPHPVGTRWQHRLLDGSMFSDDCDICGRPTLTYPVRGTFDLVVIQESAIGDSYVVTNIDLVVGYGSEAVYRMRGHGTYDLSRPLPAEQSMHLDISLNGSTNHYLFHTPTNATLPDLEWPMLGISLVETQQATLLQRFSLDLRTAPLREIWFFTTAGMTPSTLGSSNRFLAPGELLSHDGRVVRSNEALLDRLGIMPPTPLMPLDTLCLLSGGEIAFSTRSDAWSETLGQLRHGDLLSERGRVVRSNASLLASFQPQPPVADLGLDAAQVQTNGEVWFSIDTEVFSERLGVTLSEGDLLSDSGRVVRTFKQLTGNFQPTATPPTGLDAFHAWPHGEIWFSTETGFQDARLGTVLHGDLLSDRGYIVFRNLELTVAFGPLEDLADFGLCGLFVITDRSFDATPPSLLPSLADSIDATLRLRWNGSGRVFQLERASAVTGPFVPASPLLPDLEWFEPVSKGSTLFHRVHQW